MPDKYTLVYTVETIFALCSWSQVKLVNRNLVLDDNLFSNNLVANQPQHPHCITQTREKKIE